MRCPIVITDRTASTQSATSRTAWKPNPYAKAPSPTMISRSARSAIPTFAVNPSPSARALTYEITCPVTTQTSAAASDHRSPTVASQYASAQQHPGDRLERSREAGAAHYAEDLRHGALTIAARPPAAHCRRRGESRVGVVSSDKQVWDRLKYPLP